MTTYWRKSTKDGNEQYLQNSIACQIPIRNGSRLLGWRWGCCAGKILDLMEAVRNRLRFTYSLCIVADGKWGNKVNSSWKGLIGEIVDGKADIVMQNLNLLETPVEYVEFTTAYVDTSSYGILRMKKKRSRVTNLGILGANNIWDQAGNPSNLYYCHWRDNDPWECTIPYKIKTCTTIFIARSNDINLWSNLPTGYWCN